MFCLCVFVIRLVFFRRLLFVVVVLFVLGVNWKQIENSMCIFRVRCPN